MGDLQQAAQDFLTASKSYFASTPQYGKDYEAVQAALKAVSGIADNNVDIAQKQLDKMTQMVTGIEGIDISVKGVIKSTADVTQAVLNSASKFQTAFDKYIEAQKKVDAPVSNAIETTYNDVLGRPADTAGSAYWNNQVQTGAATPTEVIDAITNSPEAKLRALYKTVFGREPDAAGLQYWLNYMNGGHTIAEIEAEFKKSSEYLNPVARALGGYTPAGPVLVGEHGPEYVNFDRPGMVYTAGQTASMNSNSDAKLDAVVEAVEELRTAVVRELQAANTQRGTAATQTLSKLDKVAETVDDLTRTYERNA